MPETNEEELEKTWPGEDPPNFPDDEIGEELPEEDKGDVPVFNEEGFSNEEKLGETEEDQPSLFEGDKVYNALHTALTDINDSIKRIQKAIDSKKIELQVCETRKKEIQEAIEVYEKQRQEAE